MPYCPKCDMEFVDGITICSDCKGPLVASKEFAIQLKQEEERTKRETLIQSYRKNHPELPPDFQFPDNLPFKEEEDISRFLALISSYRISNAPKKAPTPTQRTENNLETAIDELLQKSSDNPDTDMTGTAFQRIQAEEMDRNTSSDISAVSNDSSDMSSLTSPLRPVKSSPYVKQSEKYEDLKSSASAFLGVGAVLVVVSVLGWLRIIPMPMTGISRYLFLGVLTIMGVLSLIVARSTQKSAKEAKASISSEEQNTKAILDWFLEHWTPEQIDQQILRDYGELSTEERSLKRFELIQDYLITGKDIPDISYADELSEEIYNHMFTD